MVHQMAQSLIGIFISVYKIKYESTNSHTKRIVTLHCITKIKLCFILSPSLTLFKGTGKFFLNSNLFFIFEEGTNITLYIGVSRVFSITVCVDDINSEHSLNNDKLTD